MVAAPVTPSSWDDPALAFEPRFAATALHELLGLNLSVFGVAKLLATDYIFV